ncbi:MAG: hypothetical protein ACRC0G_01405 [Fusobacteriaceae bacterium]
MKNKILERLEKISDDDFLDLINKDDDIEGFMSLVPDSNKILINTILKREDITLNKLFKIFPKVMFLTEINLNHIGKLIPFFSEAKKERYPASTAHKKIIDDPILNDLEDRIIVSIDDRSKKFLPLTNVEVNKKNNFIVKYGIVKDQKVLEQIYNINPIFTKEDKINIEKIYKMIDENYFTDEKEFIYTENQFFTQLQLDGKGERFRANLPRHVKKLKSVIETMVKFYSLRLNIVSPKETATVNFLPSFSLHTDNLTNETKIKISLKDGTTLYSYLTKHKRIREVEPIATKLGKGKSEVIKMLQSRITKKLRAGQRLNNKILIKNLVEVYNSKNLNAKTRTLKYTEEYLNQMTENKTLKSWEFNNDKTAILFYLQEGVNV